MKKILLIILLTIPFVGFSQNLSNTSWEIWQQNGDLKIMSFSDDGTFTYLKVTSVSGNENQSFGDEDETWVLKVDKIIISYNNGFMIKTGNINSEGNFMEGTLINSNGENMIWFGRKK